MLKRLMICSSPIAKSIRVCTSAKPKADGLAVLRTPLLNGGWDLYWKEQQVLPLAVPKVT
jgi:hypothetical protein